MAIKKEKSDNEKETGRLPYGLVGRVILGSIATAGFLSVALVAPNIFQAVNALKKQHKGLYRRYQSLAYARLAVKRLVEQKRIIVFQKDGVMMMRLTDKGRQELLKYQLKEKSLEKWHWDKKWRMLIFDIAEEKRNARDRMRIDMQSFGFVRLQDSVWVYPYECEQVVTLLKAQYKIGKEMLYIVAGEIEDDEWLRKKFDLK
ncbi:MAG: hypothetical protein WCG73_02450 [Candidatus Moraniibacteriota bacterium]